MTPEEKDRKLPNSFYEGCVTLKLKPYKQHKGGKLQTNATD